jgi:hypothetical protein
VCAGDAKTRERRFPYHPLALDYGEIFQHVLLTSTYFQQAPGSTDTDLGSKINPYNETHTNRFRLVKMSMRQTVP